MDTITLPQELDSTSNETQLGKELIYRSYCENLPYSQDHDFKLKEVGCSNVNVKTSQCFYDFRDLDMSSLPSIDF